VTSLGFSVGLFVGRSVGNLVGGVVGCGVFAALQLHLHVLGNSLLTWFGKMQKFFVRKNDKMNEIALIKKRKNP